MADYRSQLEPLRALYGNAQLNGLLGQTQVPKFAAPVPSPGAAAATGPAAGLMGSAFDGVSGRGLDGALGLAGGLLGDVAGLGGITPDAGPAPSVSPTLSGTAQTLGPLAGGLLGGALGPLGSLAGGAIGGLLGRDQPSIVDTGLSQRINFSDPNPYRAGPVPEIPVPVDRSNVYDSPFDLMRDLQLGEEAGAAQGARTGSQIGGLLGGLTGVGGGIGALGGGLLGGIFGGSPLNGDFINSYADNGNGGFSLGGPTFNLNPQGLSPATMELSRFTELPGLGPGGVWNHSWDKERHK